MRWTKQKPPKKKKTNESISMTRIEITRDYRPDCTLGSGTVFNGSIPIFHFKTMELPWLENQRRISCIPEGTYKTLRHTSPRFGQTFWLQDVTGRAEILTHKGNYTRDTLGCILPGKDHKDINNDGIPDVTSSGETMQHLLNMMPAEFTIKIS